MQAEDESQRAIAPPAADDDSTTPLQRNTQSPTGPLLVWLGIQLVVLALSASRISLAATYPQPAESLAPQLVLCAQVVAAALLFPFILPDLRVTVQIVAAAVPFQLAAAFLGSRTLGEMLLPACFVAAWIGALGLCRECLRSRKSQMAGLTVASVLTVGLGALRYLRLEFGTEGSAKTPYEIASPLCSTLAALDGQAIGAGWSLITAIFVIALALLARQRIRTLKLAAQETS